MVTSYQYPHFLYVCNPASNSERNIVTGNWIANVGGWKLVSACREETNGKGTMLKLVDGEARVFSSLVLLPKGVETIKAGVETMVCTEVIADCSIINAAYIAALQENGLLMVKGICLKHDAGRLHGRLWV